MNSKQAVQRAKELVSQMSVEEKASQMLYQSPAIPRLGLSSYNWWNEALHGVARAGLATVYPQAIGLAATFDPALVEQVGCAIGEEGRLKNEMSRSEEDRGIYKGLTYWSPNINIARDPRWGRAHETYGEDPCLTAAMGTAFVKGVQSNDFQAAACVKHFAVHSGPETTRHGFDAEVSRQDLWETYLPAFERVVKDAQAAGVMGAYNAINGVPCCANAWLQREVLREQWGFEGYTVSDCGAVSDISEFHQYRATRVEAAAEAVRGGCDLNCGSMYGYLLEAVQKGLLDEKLLDEAVTRLLTIRLRLEMEGPVDGKQVINQWLAHQPQWEALNRTAAEQSMVLLKNDGILPLQHPKTVAIIGPNAQSQTVLEGNYHGTAAKWTTVARGLQQWLPDSRFLISEGCHLYRDRIEGCSPLPDDRLSEAAAFARYADVTVLCLGLDPSIEGEQGDANNDYAAGDKRNLYLPESQQRLLKAVCDVTDRVVVVLLSGGALDLGAENDRVQAVLQAWYPGARGGEAVARVLTGKVNPTGRLPETFYYNEQVDWDFEVYSMEGKTYRFFEGRPLYPFGFGLAYRYLMLSDLKIAEGRVSVQAVNPHGEEVSMPIQAYITIEEPGIRTPKRQLVSLQRVTLQPGETRQVFVELPAYWMEVTEPNGKRRASQGRVTLYVSDHQPDARSAELTETPVLKIQL